ncbi:MAG TPA: hypothetical protein VHX13_03935 [Acidobacteriaceae bacterium]|jgi:hypothetical protein|nr:hypothetical protein [Acidobacteriaceae bacterium]
MADLAYRASGVPVVRSVTPWGAIWAGVFSFTAIWAVFGLLGAAIFSTAGNTANPSTGIGWGMGIWSIVLTMVAMYVGGHVTGRLASVTSRNEGALCGMTMFGLAVIAALVVVVLSGVAAGNGAASAPFMLTVFSSVGWFGFAALFLGWLCAMGGASSAAREERLAAAPIRDIRSAA